MENSKMKVFKNFSDKKITENFGNILNDYRKSGKFCDFILKTKDKCSYPVHKNIIQMNSEYFKKILSKNSELNELYFSDVESSIFNKIIEFMYTGEIELTCDTIDQISNLANILNLDSLELQCIKFMEYCKNLEKISIKKESSSSSITTRKRKQHSPSENKLDDRTEASTAPTTRQNLQLIRPPSPPPRKKINDIITSGYRNLYTIFGNRLLSYDWKRTSFNHQCITKLEEYRTHFAYSLFKGNSLFICGGNIVGNEMINNGKKCSYYNFQNNRWIKNIPELTYSRRQHRATTLYGKIYVCGGENEKHTEIFDINSMIKTYGPSLDVDMMNFGFCTLNTSIYALYGDKFRQYDPRESNWLRLIGPNGNCCNHFHESCSIIGYRDYIYKFDCKGISKFDIRAVNWEKDKIYYSKEYKQSPFVCRLDEKIYLLEQCYPENIYILQSYTISDLMELPLNDVIVAYDRPAWAFFSTYSA